MRVTGMQILLNFMVGKLLTFKRVKSLFLYRNITIPFELDAYV